MTFYPRYYDFQPFFQQGLSVILVLFLGGRNMGFGHSAGRPIRIFIVEDNQLFLQGLIFFLESVEGVEVAGYSLDGKGLVDAIERSQPDLVIMDLFLPKSSGVALTRMLRRRFKDLKVIVLSICDEEECKSNAQRAGASAYITKGQSLEELKDSIVRLAVTS
jgi:DNA-binding NarL/FixJ family response regulator